VLEEKKTNGKKEEGTSSLGKHRRKLKNENQAPGVAFIGVVGRGGGGENCRLFVKDLGGSGEVRRRKH